MTTITIDRAVVEQALEALEHLADEYGFTNKANRIERWKSVAALREALNAPQPEPVAFYNFQSHQMRWAKPTVYAEIVAVDVPELPLYAAPPQPEPEPFDLNEARNKDLFSAASQAIRHGMLNAIDEIDAEIECVEMEYAHDARLKQLIVDALDRAKELIRDRMAHGIGGDT
jgi:hypothetical protein